VKCCIDVDFIWLEVGRGVRQMNEIDTRDKMS
jgi:hypothetical protein